MLCTNNMTLLQDPDVECWSNEEEDSGDPPRLWAQNAMFPGTAFTRSIGDACEPSECIIMYSLITFFVRQLTDMMSLPCIIVLTHILEMLPVCICAVSTMHG